MSENEESRVYYAQNAATGLNRSFPTREEAECAMVDSIMDMVRRNIPPHRVAATGSTVDNGSPVPDHTTATLCIWDAAVRGTLAIYTIAKDYAERYGLRLDSFDIVSVETDVYFARVKLGMSFWTGDRDVHVTMAAIHGAMEECEFAINTLMRKVWEAYNEQV